MVVALRTEDTSECQRIACEDHDPAPPRGSNLNLTGGHLARQTDMPTGSRTISSARRDKSGQYLFPLSTNNLIDSLF
jgi:hypothetical protein